MKKCALLITFLFFNCNIFIAQVSFQIPDTVCVGAYFSIENTSTTGDDFYWSFCENDLTQLPEMSSFSIDLLMRPVFMDIQKQGENYYGFVTDVDGGIVRLDFGNSLSNDPLVVNLEDMGNLFFGMQGIQILNDNNQWWGFIVGGTGNERLIRLDFGDSLENIPTTTDLGNFAEFHFPHEVQIEKNGLDWYGLALNRWFGGSISVFAFEDGLSEPPTGLNIGDIGYMDAPTGFHLIQDGFDYFLFVVNEDDATISRIEFGGAFGGTPVGFNIGDLGILEVPRDIIVFEHCNNHFGYVLDKFFPRIVWLDFNGDLASTPDASILFENENLGFPHSFSSLIRDGGNLYLFIVNVTDKSILRLTFPICDKSSIPFYAGINPPPIKYLEPGTHLVQLIANEGSFDKMSFCKEIVVLPSPELDLGKDTTLCLGDDLVLTTNESATIWQGVEVSASFEIQETGQYVAQINGAECNSYDTIYVDFKDCEECLIFPNAFTPDGDNNNDTFEPIIDCSIDFENYKLQIYNRWGQNIFTSTNPNIGWDGRGKNILTPSDVYVWKSVFSFFKNGRKYENAISGEVTLIR